MKNVKHILWDWNGTLIDDVDLCVKTTNTLLAERMSSPICRNEYRTKFTFPVIDFYREIGFDYSQEDYSSMSEDWIKVYQDDFKAHSNLHDNVHTTLEKLREMDFTQSILSACEEKILNNCIKHHNLNHFFEFIFGTGNVQAHGKTELARHAVSSLTHSRDEILLFGDTVHDAEVAEAAGIHCVLIANGHQHEDILKTSGTEVLTSIEEVPGFLNSL